MPPTGVGRSALSAVAGHRAASPRNLADRGASNAKSGRQAIETTQQGASIFHPLIIITRVRSRSSWARQRVCSRNRCSLSRTITTALVRLGSLGNPEDRARAARQLADRAALIACATIGNDHFERSFGRGSPTPELFIENGLAHLVREDVRLTFPRGRPEIVDRAERRLNSGPRFSVHRAVHQYNTRLA